MRETSNNFQLIGEQIALSVRSLLEGGERVCDVKVAQVFQTFFTVLQIS